MRELLRDPFMVYIVYFILGVGLLTAAPRPSIRAVGWVILVVDCGAILGFIHGRLGRD